MLGRSKSAKIAEEVAALRAALDAEIAQSQLAAQALQEMRTKVEDSTASLPEQISQLRQALDGLDRRIASLEQAQDLENRMLKLEKRLDQQAEDLQGAIAGLVTRIEAANRTRKES